MNSRQPQNASNSGPDQKEVDIFVAAAGSGHDEIITDFLGKYPSAIDARDHFGYTALQMAAKCGRADMAERLLKMGADLEAQDSQFDRTPLVWAIYRGHYDAVRVLLDRGAAIETQDGMGRTPLIWAVIDDDRDTVELLLERGADINAKDSVGNTALLFARTWEKTEAVMALEQWFGKEKQRIVEQEARELAAELADYSPSLKRPIRAIRPLRAPGKGR